MTYKQLKDFCNSLTEEQLEQEVYLSQVDDAAISVDGAGVSQEDEYYDHCDGYGTLEMIKENYPDEWEEIIEEASVCPKGTVFLIHE